jgi:HAD superfamily hydrolase (TIGR01549 family)
MAPLAWPRDDGRPTMAYRFATAPRALLLDAGNTVVFLDFVAVSELLAKRGWAVAEQALEHALPSANRSYVAILTRGGGHEDGWTEFMRSWLRAAGLDAETAIVATRELRREHDRFNLWRRVPEGIREAVAELRGAGLRVGLVSNSEGQLQALLERVGLGQAFDLVIDSALEGVRKPDPEIFHRACARLGVAHADALYAGDIPEVDVRGALGAGLQAALVDPYGLYPDFAEAPRFASLPELAAALLAHRRP